MKTCATCHRRLTDAEYLLRYKRCKMCRKKIRKRNGHKPNAAQRFTIDASKLAPPITETESFWLNRGPENFTAACEAHHFPPLPKNATVKSWTDVG